MNDIVIKIFFGSKIMYGNNGYYTTNDVNKFFTTCVEAEKYNRSFK